VNPTAQAHLDAFVDKYRASAPPNWIRIVTWSAHLADENGTVDRGMLKQAEIAVVLTPEGITREYFHADSQASFDLDDLEPALDGEPESGWTMLHIEIDRDGPYRAEFDTGPARALLDSATDPYWRGVHDYVDLHRDELEQFVERLREQGDLPDAAAGASTASSTGDDRPGRLGRMFGRR
jgi:hypothetical protein